LGKPSLLGIASLTGGIGLFFAGSWLYRLVEGYSRWQVFWCGVLLLAVGLIASGLGADVRMRIIVLAAGALAVWALHYGFEDYHLGGFRARKTVLEAVRHSDKGQRNRLERQLRLYYPDDERRILPTRFGNILRAFERHPRVLYNIEPISGWTRLTTQIPEAFAAQIDDAKVNVTFRLNVALVFAVIAVELWLMSAVAHRPALTQGVPVFAAAAFLAYRSAFRPALKWGEHVRAAFDLYRLDLLERLKVSLPEGPFTLEQERKVWSAVQEATYYVADPGARLTFVLKERKTEPNGSRDPFDV
jgi:hypothetical protein